MGAGADVMMDDEEATTLLPPTDGGGREVVGRSFEEALSYAIRSFCAVLKPVACTMVLASLVVTHLQDGADDSASSSGLDVYTVYDVGSSTDASTGEKVGKSLVNALIIVSVLAGATFCIVCLYKYRCTNLLLGYMALSSMMLLGIMGGQLWFSLLQMWQLPCDVVTFSFGCVNFAVVGVVAIFRQTGIPKTVTQSYLVCTSVLMAWQLSKFEEWTGWALLFVLAIYDLCAVLTPCGPLRALVSLMQEYNTPMPGLLYEADLSRSPAQPHADFAREIEGQKCDGVSDEGQGAVVENSEHLEHGGSQDNDVHDRHGNSIKLGLGDFVFYSVLTSRAALHGFPTSAICFIMVVSGLGMTLVLLSVHEKALPALPISISLGLCFYALSRSFIMPYVDFLADSMAYV